MTIEIWYAVSKRGQGHIYTTKPLINEHFGVYEGEQNSCVTMFVLMMEADGFELPVLKFGDDPVKLKITMSYG